MEKMEKVDKMTYVLSGINALIIVLAFTLLGLNGSKAGPGVSELPHVSPGVEYPLWEVQESLVNRPVITLAAICAFSLIVGSLLFALALLNRHRPTLFIALGVLLLTFVGFFITDSIYRDAIQESDSVTSENLQEWVEDRYGITIDQETAELVLRSEMVDDDSGETDHGTYSADDRDIRFISENGDLRIVNPDGNELTISKAAMDSMLYGRD